MPHNINQVRREHRIHLAPSDSKVIAPLQRRSKRRKAVSISPPRAFDSIFGGTESSNPGMAWTAVDFTAAFACGLGVTLLRHVDQIHTATKTGMSIPSSFISSLLFAFLTATSIALLSRVTDLHDLRPHRTWLHEQGLILLTTGFSALGINSVFHLLGGSEFHKGLLALDIAITFALISLSRTLWRRRAAAHFKRGIVTRNFVIAGADATGRDVRDHLTSLAYLGYCFKGFVQLDDTVDPKISSEELLGPIANIIPLSRSLFVDEIIFSRRPETSILIGTLNDARASGIDVHLVPSISETLKNRSDLHYIGDLAIIALHQRQTRVASLFAKRLLDVSAAAFGIAATLPIWLVVAIAIKLDSAGPLFYSSNRVGFKGRIFPCYKFRTMITDAEKRRAEFEHLNEREGILFKISNDPRITRIGKFLRKYSLDELPQLWNVLRGDMSMVGPRPPISSEVAQYELDHLRRLEVTPGITGLWQVEARHKPSFENYIELDRAYVSNWSLALDLKILFRTVKVVLLGTGT